MAPAWRVLAFGVSPSLAQMLLFICSADGALITRAAPRRLRAQELFQQIERYAHGGPADFLFRELAE